jgi:hypothetical protein
LDGFFKAIPRASPDKGKKKEGSDMKGKGTKRKVRFASITGGFTDDGII